MKSEITICRRDKIIFTLFSLWLFVDTFNGYLMRNEIPIPVSQLFKLFVAIMVVIRCYRHSNAQKLLLWITLYLLLYSANILWRGEDFASSMILLSKFLTTCIFFLYFGFVAISNQKFFKKEVFKVFKINLIVFVGNILLGLLGIGYHSYADNDGIGYCGFFYAPNELSGLVAVIFPWSLYYVKMHFSRFKYLMFCLLLFLIAYLLSSKSAILATFLSFSFISFFYGSKKERRLVVFIVLGILFIFFIYIQTILSSDIPILSRLNWFIEQQGVLNALTSNRLEYWKEEGQEFYNAGVLSWIFGLGGDRTVEMDPYDALLNCGYIGFVFLLILYVKLIITPQKRKYKKIHFKKVVLVSNIVLIFISIIAGHVLFSSTAGLFIAMSNAMLYTRASDFVFVENKLN